MGESKPFMGLLTLFLLLGCLVAVSPASGEDVVGTLSSAGWTEGAFGRWSSLPERKAEVRENGLSGEFTLAPGTGVSWEKKGSWEVAPGTVLSYTLSSDGVNATSRDYDGPEARFPVALTVVFGKDSGAVPLRRRLAGLFRELWHGFRPSGISLTYAWGNKVPVGSMYRAGEEETVFILAGEEDRGKGVSGRRDIRDDFRAAYGRDPRGPVTRLVVRAARPSAETGTVRSGFALAFPAR